MAIGGGSNAMGLFHPFLDDPSVRMHGVEAAGDGVETGRHAASLAGGRPGVLHGNRTYLLQDEDGQIIEAHSISAGLDYPGIGPEHSWLHDMGRVTYLSATDEEARQEYWPGYKGMHDRIGAERGWPPIGRADFEREVAHGALHVGAPKTVARKIAATAKALGIVRFDLKYSAGTLAHDKLMRCIELYGSKVMQLVRDMLA